MTEYSDEREAALKNMIEIQEKEARRIHWRTIKSYILEMDWAGSKTLRAVQEAIIEHVEKRLG